MGALTNRRPAAENPGHAAYSGSASLRLRRRRPLGKLSVPDAILKKPGPLDDDEYAAVREHAERGYRLLSEAVRGLVRDHHERLDGRGYPRGLVAEQLSLDARILAVCDVYDALRSKRVYRSAWSHEAREPALA